MGKNRGWRESGERAGVCRPPTTGEHLDSSGRGRACSADHEEGTARVVWQSPSGHSPTADSWALVPASQPGGDGGGLFKEEGGPGAAHPRRLGGKRHRGEGGSHEPYGRPDAWHASSTRTESISQAQLLLCAATRPARGSSLLRRRGAFHPSRTWGSSKTHGERPQEERGDGEGKQG
ncbi:hypothetical protein HPB50_005124 [Hyalomma asiaticum]|uniref:Uncharacterized protein n=1 Tax=Hyalomma asiaticum TaxID=266040 RepID=A0ACB7TF88_HYAAI|nr:hypothetical protein HPB50_005124 [Hyalomma asiaticum]